MQTTLKKSHEPVTGSCLAKEKRDGGGGEGGSCLPREGVGGRAPARQPSQLGLEETVGMTVLEEMNVEMARVPNLKMWGILRGR